MRYFFTAFGLALALGLAACAADTGWNVASNGNGYYHESNGSAAAQTDQQSDPAAPVYHNAGGNGLP